ncbi:MAG: NADH dehydrogenase [Ignavibacteria bacterium RIFOXYB2_FULL_35_12]|nr:MAG: NADH dehydrogenase [Ignavibacteria bacterium GWA2_36_19]OGU57081.1 MAG: NADH dehydrogenase [Ignavibacteria bacterium GWF2_35_20]OGU81688.1 MAG: NADH dehydrogenase [Ignavibacteria bacterium RIFOXYA2_FULL_35_9]OGU88841.1 MAG: NADH dehydrogenase [Ignavibacteria bacterium RIFOXYA12_FULL_35_25]OGU90662.1 MAG: NADH dehydrogenase [Ignavibacteria bacterium RIFOXYC12_FULL_35_11]OGU93683.1 MAG: NADH dehydrogenase [Ignavibacteria bacterium RIFOXYB12_FULL_35_14]OGV00643.1 MAG: NADH dehydrogenase 
MKSPEEIFKILKDKFGESIIELKSGVPVESYIVVDPMKIDEVCLFLKDEPELKFDNCMNLSGVDDANGKKEAQTDGSSVIIGGTLSVVYHLESVYLKHKLTLKVAAPRENPQVKSVANIWRSADWNEREAYDLYGINFMNHPDLRRILMPYDWEAGYPLRKDYKNPEFYQGMKVPY